MMMAMMTRTTRSTEQERPGGIVADAAPKEERRRRRRGCFCRSTQIAIDEPASSTTTLATSSRNHNKKVRFCDEIAIADVREHAHNNNNNTLARVAHQTKRSKSSSRLQICDSNINNNNNNNNSITVNENNNNVRFPLPRRRILRSVSLDSERPCMKKTNADAVVDFPASRPRRRPSLKNSVASDGNVEEEGKNLRATTSERPCMGKSMSFPCDRLMLPYPIRQASVRELHNNNNNNKSHHRSRCDFDFDCDEHEHRNEAVRKIRAAAEPLQREREPWKQATRKNSDNIMLLTYGRGCMLEPCRPNRGEDSPLLVTPVPVRDVLSLFKAIPNSV